MIVYYLKEYGINFKINKTTINAFEAIIKILD